MKKLLFTVPALIILLSASTVLAQDTSTDSAGSIREKVIERIQTKLRSPKAAIGTVTDITDTTVSIRSVKGDIVQASIEKDKVAVIKVAKVSKKVAFKELAIGDFIITMGYKNGNGVLETKRILITQPVAADTRKAFFGVVTQVGKDKLTIKETTNGKLDITGTIKTVKITEVGKTINLKFSQLRVGDKVILVGTQNGDVFEVRRIYVTELTNSTSPSPSPKITP